MSECRVNDISESRIYQPHTEPIDRERVKFEWEATVDSLKELICLIDGNACLVRINRTVERWQNTQVETLLGKPLHGVLHPDCVTKECYLAIFLGLAPEQLRQGERPWVEAFDPILERYLRIEIRRVFIHPKYGEPGGEGEMVFVAQDMTELKQVEKRLSQTELELHAILRSFPDLFLYVDDQGTILDFKGGIGIGIPLNKREEPLVSVFPPLLAEKVRGEIDRVCHHSEVRTIDFQMRVEGVEKFFEARFIALSGTHALMIIRDVTEKLRLESIAEAVVTMNNIGYVFSGIRHEIGNPLNSIKMTLSVLKNNQEKFDHQTVENYIQRTLSELAKIEYLLKSLKNFTIYERVELEDFKVDLFFKKFLALIRDDCAQRSIRLEYDLATDLDCFVIDPRAFQQVLLNIISNAFDAMNLVESPLLSLRVGAAGDFVFVAIADNGVGMDDKQLHHLFKPFFTSKQGGSGLGLVIAKKMLLQMNGSIQIDSKKDQGSLVTIKVPMCRPR